MAKFFLILCSFLAAFGFTSLLHKLAPRFNLVQPTNTRASHAIPTATGGGISFAILGLVVGGALSFVDADLIPYLLFAATLAVVGFLDDLYEVPALWRFAVQFIATLILFWSVGTYNLIVQMLGGNLHILAVPICLLGAVWWLNLINFMDGIDGLVATQSVTIIVCVSLLNHFWIGLPFGSFELWGLVIGSAILGFAMLNFPPAKIFMGDAGSYFIAAALFGLFLNSTDQSSPIGIVWLLLAIPMVCDASATLFIRMLRQEKWYAPHRQHVYQRLSRKWASHRASTLTYLAATVFVLLPLSVFSLVLPSLAIAILLFSYAAGVAVFIVLGAGQPDDA